MKKKLTKAVGTIVLVGTLCCNLNTFATETNTLTQAQDVSLGIITPYFLAITDYSNSLILNAGGKLTCVGDTTAQSGYTGGVTVELQRYSGGWATIKSWSDTPASRYACVEANYYVTSGYNYRLKVTHKVYSGGTVVETFTSYSNTVAY